MNAPNFGAVLRDMAVENARTQASPGMPTWRYTVTVDGAHHESGTERAWTMPEVAKVLSERLTDGMDEYAIPRKCSITIEEQK